MKEIKKLKFQEPHKFKRKLTKTSTFNLKLAETFDSANSAAERSNLEKSEVRTRRMWEIARGTAKTCSSCWRVWIRLEYRWFGGRKTHLQGWETCPCSYVFLEEEVFRNDCDQKIFSAPRVALSSSSQSQTQSSQPGTANSGFLSRRPNIKTCFACGKTGDWRACFPAKTKQSDFPT